MHTPHTKNTLHTHKHNAHTSQTCTNIHTHTTHTHTTHTHTLHTIPTHTTHTHYTKSKAKLLAAAKQSRQPSEQALGCLGTTQALRAGASKSTLEGRGGRASTPKVELCHAPG